MSSPVAVKVSGADRQAVADAAAPSDKAPAVKAPAFKRPKDMGDIEWDLLRLSKSPDMASSIMDVIAGIKEPSADEAALMLDVTKAAEMSALRQIRKLQTQLAPKIAELRERYNSHMSASAHLFQKATAI